MVFDFTLGFIIGFGLFVMFEFFCINFVYLKNLDLFNDLILTKKSSEKLKKYYGDKK